MVELIDASCTSFDCTKCSLRKECDECEMKHKTYLCDVMGCFFFVNRGKVTEIKMEEENGIPTRKHLKLEYRKH